MEEVLSREHVIDGEDEGENSDYDIDMGDLEALLYGQLHYEHDEQHPTTDMSSVINGQEFECSIEEEVPAEDELKNKSFVIDKSTRKSSKGASKESQRSPKTSTPAQQSKSAQLKLLSIEKLSVDDMLESTRPASPCANISPLEEKSFTQFRHKSGKQKSRKKKHKNPIEKFLKKESEGKSDSSVIILSEPESENESDTKKKLKKKKNKVIVVHNDNSDNSDNSIQSSSDEAIVVSDTTKSVEVLSDSDNSDKDNNSDKDSDSGTESGDTDVGEIDYDNVDINVKHGKSVFDCSKLDMTQIKKLTVEDIHDSLGDGDWSVDIKDQVATTSRGKPGSRYYKPFSVRCDNCKERGHISRDCELPRKEPACILCGTRGHTSSQCKHKHCYNCYGRGHESRDCPEFKPEKHSTCHRCGMQGHIQRLCPDLWRQYHLTVKPGRIVEGEYLENPNMSCSNCASNKHYFYECNKPGMDRWAENAPYPFIAEYREMKAKKRNSDDEEQEPKEPEAKKKKTEWKGKGKQQGKQKFKQKQDQQQNFERHTLTSYAEYFSQQEMGNKSQDNYQNKQKHWKQTKKFQQKNQNSNRGFNTNQHRGFHNSYRGYNANAPSTSTSDFQRTPKSQWNKGQNSGGYVQGFVGGDFNAYRGGRGKKKNENEGVFQFFPKQKRGKRWKKNQFS